MDIQNNQFDPKAKEKEVKKLVDSYIVILTNKLGRSPTLDELQGAIADDSDKSNPGIQASDVPVPGRDQQPPLEASEMRDDTPRILKLKIYYGMGDGEPDQRKPDPSKILFYENPDDGSCYDCQSQQWVMQRPAVLDHLNSRPITAHEKDIVHSIAHGIMDDRDYDILASSGLIPEVGQNLWKKMQHLNMLTQKLNDLNKSAEEDSDDKKEGDNEQASEDAKENSGDSGPSEKGSDDKDSSGDNERSSENSESSEDKKEKVDGKRSDEKRDENGKNNSSKQGKAGAIPDVSKSSNPDKELEDGNGGEESANLPKDGDGVGPEKDAITEAFGENAWEIIKQVAMDFARTGMEDQIRAIVHEEINNLASSYEEEDNAPDNYMEQDPLKDNSGEQNGGDNEQRHVDAGGQRSDGQPDTETKEKKDGETDEGTSGQSSYDDGKQDADADRRDRGGEHTEKSDRKPGDAGEETD